MSQKIINICILGGGFGGLYTALSLNNFAQSQPCQITLVEQKEHFLFTPLLYEYLTRELDLWEISPSYYKLLRGKAINFYQETIKAINLQKRQVDLADGATLNYDYLVIALGSKTRKPNIEGADNLLYFRSLQDAELLDNRLKILETSSRIRLRLAVVGGGANGVELATKLGDRLGKRGEIHLFEKGKEILKQFNESVKKAALKAIEKRKIKIHYQSEIQQIKEDGAYDIRFREQEEKMNLSVDLIIWTTGIETLDLVKQLECEKKQGKLLTLPTLQLNDYPEVFALGDIGTITERYTPATAQSAYQQARVVAKNLQALIQKKNLKKFSYFHLGDMLATGKRVGIVSSFFITLEGRLPGIIRRLAYIQRLPTHNHRWQVMKNFFVSKWHRLASPLLNYEKKPLN